MRRSWLILALGLLCLLGVSATRLARAASAPQITPPGRPLGGATPTPCPPAWQIVPSPSAGARDNYLYGGAAVSSSDVWAVGQFYTTFTTFQTRIEHWDGSAWSIIPSPNPSTALNTLLGVAAVSSNDVWAVGYYATSSGPPLTLVEHWDGSAWAVVPSPNPGTNFNRLRSVAVVSANDVWAVGHYGNDNFTARTLVEHWDGSAWAVVPSPNVTGHSTDFYGVTALSATDVWAVGDEHALSGNFNTLVEHWNGSAWNLVPSPNPGTSSNHLASVTAASANDVWSVGSYMVANVFMSLVEHWDGSAWSVVPSPNPTGYGSLSGVAAVSSSEVWAVGDYGPGGSARTLVAHWDGGVWTVVPSPNRGTGTNYLTAVAAGSPGDIWAVGYYDDMTVGLYQTLTEHWSEACAGTTPTPAATSTPTALPSATGIPPSAIPPPLSATPPTPPPSATLTTAPSSTATTTPELSNTPPPPSATATAPGPSATPAPSAAPAAPPTATATPCGLSFSDVHPTDYFSTPVGYLACRGVISGYADGTFRPYNNTTRAQLVKIVVLGFALATVTPPVPDAYAFADVPPGNPYYFVVETGIAHQIISGYPCGGPTEPCDDRQRSYFRPNANVTRGQLSKIVVSAANWAQLEPAVGSFADVPPGSAFYGYVETAVCNGIISGYACGGPGEPCDTQQRPYFRPATSAVRGQIAKIVYRALTGPLACTADVARP